MYLRTAVVSISYRLSGHQTPVIGYQLSAIGYQLSAIGYQLSAIDYQAISHRLSGHQPPAIGYQLSGYRLSAILVVCPPERHDLIRRHSAGHTGAHCRRSRQTARLHRFIQRRSGT